MILMREITDVIDVVEHTSFAKQNWLLTKQRSDDVSLIFMGI